jgi:CO dehydrogenase/acetyl-CoA synthase alpha subunit
MTTEVIDNSILARILGNGDTSTFVPSTDGLHAAGVDLDAILLDTGTTLDGRIPAALVGGKMDSSVSALANDTITAASIAADAIGASELAADAANEIADATLDRANAIETGLTLRQALRIVAAACAGKVSGAGTATVVIRNAVVDGTDRIVATVDVDGNRTAVAYDLT